MLPDVFRLPIFGLERRGCSSLLLSDMGESRGETSRDDVVTTGAGTGSVMLVIYSYV
jgi:hypothetical protein